MVLVLFRTTTSTRPYGFPPALWVALHKGTTMVLAYECEDPLCRWMFMSYTPDHTLSIQQRPGSNGQVDWRISSLTDGYMDGVNKTRRVRDPPPKPDLWTIISIQEWRKGMPAWQRRREKKEDKRKAKHL